ncbi:MAG TPA: purine-nucleoside phosphorylase [Anaerolineaceae bacterium]|nr:purine-nucleoside phosphorylase [Anaerolineaceae bacterium]HPN53277.1 purine-nucleoside phosphorylase [Anaerolineaceae bacterium]
MEDFITLEQIDQAVDMVRRNTRHQPEIGIILGSGLGGLADAVEDADSIPFCEIPFWPTSTVYGHEGRLVIGKLEGKLVMMMQGRAHYYEGYSMSHVGLPVRVMQRMGIKTLVVTNAAGAIRPDFMPGDLMLIYDHIALVGMVGMNPLRGPNLDVFGPRFPDMSQAYDRDLLALAEIVAAEKGIEVRKGVYICLSGPSFEGPADLRFLRAIGADAVGMSTVPEVIVARHGGMRVLGISGISNKANLDGSTITTHEEVLEAGRIIVPKLVEVIRGVVKRC